MQRTKVADNIEYIEPTKSPFVNTSAGLIISSSPKMLIDTNLERNATIELLKTEKPDMAMITHYHIDHSLWGRLVLDHSAADFIIPEAEAGYLTDIDYFIGRCSRSYGHADEWKVLLRDVIGYRELDRYSTHADGTEFKTGGKTIQCIGTPGHSPGHTSFYIPEEKILFTGDMGIGRYGPWYGWEDCDLPDYVESILRLKSMDAAVLLTSHDGMVTSDIDRAWDACLGRLFERERFVQERLESGMTREQIAQEGIYVKNKSRIVEPMRRFLVIWDSIMVDHHVAMLHKGSLRKLFPEV